MKTPKTQTTKLKIDKLNYIKNFFKNEYFKGVKRKPFPYPCGLLFGNVKWCSHCGKQYENLSRVWFLVTPWTVAHQAPLSMEFSRQENCHSLLQDFSYEPAIPLLNMYFKELKAGAQKYICVPMFIAALFTVAKNVKITVNFFLPLSMVDHDNQSWKLSTTLEFSLPDGLEQQTFC